MKNFCAKVLNLRAQSTATATLYWILDLIFYDDFGGAFDPAEVIVKFRSRIQDQVAESVDCA